MTTKNKIVFISLAVLLIALIVVYFVVIAPLLNEETKIPEPQDGEGLYNNKLTIFEPIDESNLVSIHVKNQKDEYTFERIKEKDGTYSIVIDGYEKLIYDETYFAFLKSYSLAPITVDGQVFRNCSADKMKEYGVTADTCQATLEVKYKDSNGAVKTHTLRIGHAAFTASPSYYVSIDGRNHVYRFSYGVEGSILLPISDYISPIINAGYSSSSEALIDIRTFSISKGKLTNFAPYIVVTNERITDTFINDKGESETYYSAESTFHIMNGSKIIKSTAADYDYAMNSIALFYTNFMGDKCIAINPDKATLEKYGLGDDDERYIVNAQRHPLTPEDIKNGAKEFDLPTFFISMPIYDEEEKANFYYTVAYQSEIPLLIRIPESAFIPQNQFKDVDSIVFDESKTINWAATNTIGSGLKEALDGSVGAKYHGIKELTIKVPTSVYQYGEETFYIQYVYDEEKGVNIPKITTKSGRYTDKSDVQHKPFNQFYFTLISHPLAQRFNTLEDSVIEEILANPSNNLYTVEAVLNLNEGETKNIVQRFQYYKINSSTVTSTEYVIIYVTEGYYDNGVFVESEASAKKSASQKTVFDTTKNQITDYIHKDFVALMNGTFTTGK